MVPGAEPIGCNYGGVLVVECFIQKSTAYPGHSPYERCDE